MLVDPTYLAMVFASSSFTEEEKIGIRRIAHWMTRVNQKKVQLKTDAQRAFYSAHILNQLRLPPTFDGSNAEQHYELWRRFLDADAEYIQMRKQKEKDSIERHEKAKRDEPMRRHTQLRAMLAKTNRPASILSQEERADYFKKLNKSDVDFDVSPYLTRADGLRRAKQIDDEQGD